MRGILNRARVLKRMSWLLTAAVAALMVVGVLAVYSAGHGRIQQETLYQKQIVWAMLGVLCYLGVAMSDYRRIGENVWWLYALGLVLLIVVLAVGDVIYGAKRWLMVFGIQPSELSKLAIIGVLAWYLGRPDVDLLDFRTLVFVLALLGVPLVLIIKEPDLGTGMVLLSVGFILLFAGGINGRYLGAMALMGALAAGFVFGALLLPERLGMNEERQKRIWHMTHLSDYQRDRLLVFLHPGRDQLKSGWNKMQSEIAVGSGGLKGRGPLQGEQSNLGFLPKTVALDELLDCLQEVIGR